MNKSFACGDMADGYGRFTMLFKYLNPVSRQGHQQAAGRLRGHQHILHELADAGGKFHPAAELVQVAPHAAGEGAGFTIAQRAGQPGQLI